MAYTKVGIFFLSIFFPFVFSCSVMSDSLRPHGLQPARILCPWGFSRQEYWCRLPCPLLGGMFFLEIFFFLYCLLKLEVPVFLSSSHYFVYACCPWAVRTILLVFKSRILKSFISNLSYLKSNSLSTPFKSLYVFLLTVNKQHHNPHVQVDWNRRCHHVFCLYPVFKLY